MLSFSLASLVFQVLKPLVVYDWLNRDYIILSVLGCAPSRAITCTHSALMVAAASCSGLAALPSVRGLTALSRLDLFDNKKLLQLPLLGELAALEYFDVSHCVLLSQLPDSFGGYLSTALCICLAFRHASNAADIDRTYRRGK